MISPQDLSFLQTTDYNVFCQDYLSSLQIKSSMKDEINNPTHPPQDESEDEEDFMSDKYIIEAAKVDRLGIKGGDKSSKKKDGYTEQRRKKLNDDYDRGKILPRAQREREARQKGLAKNLFGEFDDEEDIGSTSTKRKGTENEQRGSKAMRMMLAMGFKPGEALGKSSLQSHIPELDDDDSDDESANTASNPLTNPLDIDERWLDPRNKRSGIGIAPRIQSATAAISKDIDRAIDKENNASSNLEQDFRIRNRAAQEERHIEALSVSARKTCQELDSMSPYNMTYSPLWINPEALKKSKHELPTHVAELIDFAFQGLETKGEITSEEKKKNASPHENDMLNEQQNEEKEATIKRADDARRFCFLPPKARLQIILSHLRRAHHYCLFCGHQYSDEEELNSLCPGEEEDDH
jgi:Domain of unknown function (DUF4187)/G-patch domain